MSAAHAVKESRHRESKRTTMSKKIDWHYTRKG